MDILLICPSKAKIDRTVTQRVLLCMKFYLEVDSNLLERKFESTMAIIGSSLREDSASMVVSSPVKHKLGANMTT